MAKFVKKRLFLGHFPSFQIVINLTACYQLADGIAALLNRSIEFAFTFSLRFHYWSTEADPQNQYPNICFNDHHFTLRQYTVFDIHIRILRLFRMAEFSARFKMSRTFGHLCMPAIQKTCFICLYSVTFSIWNAKSWYKLNVQTFFCKINGIFGPTRGANFDTFWQILTFTISTTNAWVFSDGLWHHLKGLGILCTSFECQPTSYFLPNDMTQKYRVTI